LSSWWWINRHFSFMIIHQRIFAVLGPVYMEASYPARRITHPGGTVACILSYHISNAKHIHTFYLGRPSYPCVNYSSRQRDTVSRLFLPGGGNSSRRVTRLHHVNIPPGLLQYKFLYKYPGSRRWRITRLHIIYWYKRPLLVLACLITRQTHTRNSSLIQFIHVRQY
jgi:hypothetical protein